ncbi:MAG: hypothetical protein ACYSN9_01925, partial [Planctomycetota bacterium]
MRYKTSLVMLLAGLLLCSAVSAADLEENWNDFLHYTMIGRLELAESYANQIIASEPDPTQLLTLSEE